MHRRYLESSFLNGVAFFAGMLTLMSLIVLYQDWGRWVLLKGFVTFVLVLVLRKYLLAAYNAICRVLARGPAKKRRAEGYS